ncbi:uncharacterized protein BDR25DRAFT_296593 [Lindgomyces ingoldianus]|uniref:Uncharacterized protein n=1 Tax=Lindgomyces ingoldianus TaxID=673940 RepID=A0ACB6QCG2_9PLEO|nr:uncharacterized protein BDR25DRAFT_296593 [Lindgomyces ingoldianus]KAF2464628.1 hypothetical protein BDR25DRAFT_296593 [Lindgomyces ingoldianus]
MDGREIPGFYFDEDKKKYFRITTGHTGTTTVYTADKLKSKEKHKCRATAKADKQKQAQKETIRSHNTFLPYLARSCLAREIGARPQRSYYAQHAWSAAVASGFQPVVLAPESLPRYWDIDPVTNCLYVACEDGSVRHARLMTAAQRRNQPQHKRAPSIQYENFKLAQMLSRLTSQISSLNYVPTSGTLVVTTLGGDRPPIVHLSDPGRDSPGVAEQFTPRNISTIWTSAPRPSFSISDNSVPENALEYVAAGASQSLMLFTRRSLGTWTPSTPLKLSTDIQALTWLSPNVLALGCRDTAIHIYDLRSRGSSHILTHTSPISCLRPADDFTRLVCSGLNDTLMLYDMRMPAALCKTTRTSFPPPNGRQVNIKRKRKRPIALDPLRTNPHTPSQPVLQFPYANVDDPELGFDVHARLGLVAGVDEDGRMIIWSLRTGEELRVFERDAAGSGHNRKPSFERARCVRFVEEEGGGRDQEVSVWSVWKGGLTSFRW